MAAPRLPVRADRADPARVPGGRRRLRGVCADPRVAPPWPAHRGAGRRCARAGLPGPCAALDGAQLHRPRPLRAALDRRRQGALRRHLPAGGRRLPAGQGDPRRALPGAQPRAGLGGARPGQSRAAVQPGRAPLSRSPPGQRPRQDRQAGAPQRHHRPPARLRGDAGQEGRADVGQRGRVGDREPGGSPRPTPARALRPGRARDCSPGGGDGRRSPSPFPWRR